MTSVIKPLLNFFFKAASVCVSLFFNKKTTGAVALGQSQSQEDRRFWFLLVIPGIKIRACCKNPGRGLA